MSIKIFGYATFIFLISCNSTPQDIKEVRLSTDLAVSEKPDASVAVETKPRQITLEIQGSYCPNVSEKCIKWLDTDISPTANGGMGPLRCAPREISVKT